jgi:hypothetical protein
MSKELTMHNGDVTEADVCDHDWRTYEAVVGDNRIDVCEHCEVVR